MIFSHFIARSMATPTHQKKLRADSKLAGLTAEQLEELNRMLMAGSCTLEDACGWLEARGVVMTPQALSKYYRRRVLPERWRYTQEAAAALNAVNADDVAPAAHRAIAARVFELATGPCAVDVKELAELYKLMIAGETVQQAERKLTLTERKAAQADAVREQLESKRASGGLSPEALALAEEALGLL